MNTSLHPLPPPLTRREMLARCSTGFGMLALAGLLSDPAYAAPASTDRETASDPFAPRKPHFKPRAKNVIFCYMSGGVSHIDSFDPKARLAAESGRPMPFKTERTMFNQDGNIMPSPWEFHSYGQSGIPVSDLYRNMGSCADDLAVIRSMTVKFMEHAQGNFYFHSGQPFTGFPTLGAWTTYGLGSESRDLPGFVVLGSGGIPLGGINMFGNGFLPAVHQGSFLYPESPEPLNNIKPKEPDALQRKRLAFIDSMDRAYIARVDEHPQVEAAIRNYEIAYRMQTAVPDLGDISGDTTATK
jgi:hypothetical protein